jgi:hypothetical protein
MVSKRKKGDITELRTNLDRILAASPLPHGADQRRNQDLLKSFVPEAGAFAREFGMILGNAREQALYVHNQLLSALGAAIDNSGSTPTLTGNTDGLVLEVGKKEANSRATPCRLVVNEAQFIRLCAANDYNPKHKLGHLPANWEEIKAEVAASRPTSPAR